MTLDEWYEKAKSYLLRSARENANDAQAWAVAHHPWENVSGEAEKHLYGYVQDTGGKIGFGVAQGMWYGKYLETAHDGKNAVCKKAIDHFIPEFNKQVSEVLKVRPS